tara:strand:- start:7089 stop:7802 length:714 start_codon:yes stop_codon:yes gene_type:complete
MVSEINWGEPIENFPTGGWDNFDGVIDTIEYEQGNFGMQIHIVIQPEEYEYEARGMTYDPDSPSIVQNWYGMGGDTNTYQVSEDGYSVIGPQPNQRTRAVRLIKGIIQHSNKNLKGGNIQPLEGALVHWKNTPDGGRNPETGQVNKDTTHYYPVSPPVGAKGSTLDAGKVEEAHALLALIMGDNETVRIRQIPQLALEHEEEFGSDVVKLVADPKVVESAIRAEIVERVDERTIGRI